MSEVNQRPSAKFGVNRPIGGAINRELSNHMKVDYTIINKHLLLPNTYAQGCEIYRDPVE